MIDQYFTPKEAATKTLENIEVGHVNIVADFTVGDGSLISALTVPYQLAIGVDLDKKIIKSLSSVEPGWLLLCDDFLNLSNKNKDKLSKYVSGIDLILLNPPFSCRGGKRTKMLYNGKILSCRSSLAFVINSLKYLSNDGQLMAILPLSSIKSDADNYVFQQLGEAFELTFLTKFDRDTFANCNPRSILLRIKKRKAIKPLIPHVQSYGKRVTISLVRGNTPIYKTEQRGLYRVIHTTNINSNGGFEIKIFSNNLKRYVEGHFLFVPRVGLPKQQNVRVMFAEQATVLSDCVIGLCGRNERETELVRQSIHDNWISFLSMYESTCAPYITIRQLKDFLGTYGFAIHSAPFISIPFNIVDCLNDQTDFIEECFVKVFP